MKNNLLFPVILFAGLVLLSFSASNAYGQNPQTNKTMQQTVKYTCTVHPEVIQDMPGNCPICGKKLVEKREVVKENVKKVNDTLKTKPEPKEMKIDTTKKMGS